MTYFIQFDDDLTIIVTDCYKNAGFTASDPSHSEVIAKLWSANDFEQFRENLHGHRKSRNFPDSVGFTSITTRVARAYQLKTLLLEVSVEQTTILYFV